MKIQPIHLSQYSKPIKNKIQKQINDAFTTFGFIGFPVSGIVSLDYAGEKYKKSEFSKVF